VEQDHAFGQAVVACTDSLYRFALSLCRNGAMAEDLVQEACVRALQAARRPAPDESVKSWLFTILHNVWRNELRRRHPEPLEDNVLLFEPAAPKTQGPEDTLAQARLEEVVRDAVETLPAAFREVVLLRCVDEFSYQQIAGIVGCPAGTVMSRLSRARALLRRCLERPARAVREQR
jgi:RNA polymerase sigma-70 factor (ECF subfamily)